MNNYHTHTFRCGHGRGTEEDMVLQAIHMEMKELGFSEHVPLPHYRLFALKAFLHDPFHFDVFLSFGSAMVFNGLYMRMPYFQRKKYEKSVKDVKERFKDHIDIYLGYECEYFEDYFDYYKKLLKDVDYLILGNHYHRYPYRRYYYGKSKLSDDMLLKYKDDMIKGIQSGLFCYVAHPDLFLKGRSSFDELCKEVSLAICKEAKKYDMPLELNAGGVRKKKKMMNGKEVYPFANEHFFEIAGQVGNDIIIGIDAHQIEHFNLEDIKKLFDIVKKYDLHVIDRIDLKRNL